MLIPTAGSRLFIADYPQRWGGGTMPPSVAWVEIGETEALGSAGASWELDEAEIHAGELPGELQIWQHKRSRRALPQQIIFGMDPLDPGQRLLRAAERSLDVFPFRLVFPDEVTWRIWFASVTALGEVYDAANSVMKLQAEILPDHSPVIRSEDA